MKDSLAAMALVIGAVSAPLAFADGPQAKILIQGSLAPAGNPEGHCGGSLSGLILSGQIISIAGKPAQGVYDDCADDISPKLKASPSLSAPSAPADARVAEILKKVEAAPGPLNFTIDKADIMDGYAYGGTVVEVGTLDGK